MIRLSMPHLEIGPSNKAVDLYFELLDPESRKLLYADLKAGNRIKLPNFGDNISNIIPFLSWDELNIIDRAQIEKLIRVKGPEHPKLKYNSQTKEYEKIRMRTAGYVKEDLVPGYSGKFVIHEHDARNLHWDLRLEFPVTSVAESLKEYGEKRPEGRSPEPAGQKKEKAGTVLRSWAVPKHTLPASKPLLATETEDHAVEYGSFSGRIPEGEYGAGTVDIFDHGIFRLLDADYDKKYVFELKGRKVRGVYSLIKTHGKQFLWIRVKNTDKYKISRIISNFRAASAIDYVRPTMSEQLWDISKDPPELLKHIRDAVRQTFNDDCKKAGLTDPFRWVKGLYISGSSTGYNYKENGDLDIDILFDSAGFKECYPKHSSLDSRGIFELLKKAIYTANGQKVDKTDHTYSFMVLEEGDHPSADAIYDLLTDSWLKVPVKLPVSFDPDKAFIKERKTAMRTAVEIDILIGRIIRLADDLIKLNQYIGKYDRFNNRKMVWTAKLKLLCDRLDRYHTVINKMTETAKTTSDPMYSSYPIGPNWDSRQVVFKYLARGGYHRPVHMLYERLNDDEKALIDQFIPD
jgi:hypothetical protein